MQANRTSAPGRNSGTRCEAGNQVCARIVVTGASGHIGRAIIPKLIKAGLQIVVLGRDTKVLTALYPELCCRHIDDADDVFRGAGIVLHLAARNNNRPGHLSDFMRANVDLSVELARKAGQAGVPEFIVMSSVHAATARPENSYAVSKKAMEDALEKMPGTRVTVLRLPAVYGETFAGRLACLNRLPAALRKPALVCLSAFRPTLSADTLADHIISGATSTVLTEGQSRNPVFQAVKRTMDFAFAAVVMLLFWWLLLLIAIWIRATSAGPVIFRQERLGRHEKPFILYKFRTMGQGTRQAGTHEVSRSCVTPVGRLLRASKLDELPQVLNLLKGEMSLIGPRPGLPSQSRLTAARRQAGVFAVRPGITGLSQVEGIDMRTPSRLARRDADYIALQSVMSEFRIVLATLAGPFRSRARLQNVSGRGLFGPRIPRTDPDDLAHAFNRATQRAKTTPAE